MPGQFSTNAGATDCMLCPINTFGITSGLSKTCASCPEGRFQHSY
jgi:hypothetical protein